MKAVSASADAVMTIRATIPERSKTPGVTRPVFLKSENVAPRNVRAGFINQGLRPCHIVRLVALVVREFGNAVIDQLTRRLFDRSEVAGCDMRLDPRFLFGCERYRHAFLYHKSLRVSERKPAFILPRYSAPAKPLFSKGGGQRAEFLNHARTPLAKSRGPRTRSPMEQSPRRGGPTPQPPSR